MDDKFKTAESKALHTPHSTGQNPSPNMNFVSTIIIHTIREMSVCVSPFFSEMAKQIFVKLSEVHVQSCVRAGFLSVFSRSAHCLVTHRVLSHPCSCHVSHACSWCLLLVVACEAWCFSRTWYSAKQRDWRFSAWRRRLGALAVALSAKSAGRGLRWKFSQNVVEISTSDVMHPPPSAADQCEGEKACGRGEESWCEEEA